MIDKGKLKRMVRKMGNKTRVLYTYSAEHPEIKKEHEAYTAFFEDHFIPSTFSHAYTKGRSIYTNARVHLLNDVFIKIDVKNFFPSLNHQHLVDSMHFELNKKHQNAISLSECRSIVNSCSLHKVGLPLGLIPSPTLSNIYMKRFDSLLYGKLKHLNLRSLRYTRYADDIFISFKLESDTPSPDRIKTIIEICGTELRRCHLNVNDKKTRVVDLSISNHVKVAGVNIVRLEDGTRKLTVSRKLVKELYFRAIEVAKIQAQSADTSSDRDTEIHFIKGMQSFILSIEKKGYSHILSTPMKQQVEMLGYQNLEQLIAALKASS